jgi:hypothetical protein
MFLRLLKGRTWGVGGIFRPLVDTWTLLRR